LEHFKFVVRLKSGSLWLDQRFDPGQRARGVPCAICARSV
jgi:hypothetical protein